MKILPTGIPWNPAEPFPLIAAEGVVVVRELKMAGCCWLARRFSDAARTSKEPRNYAALSSQPFSRDESTWYDVTHGESIADVRPIHGPTGTSSSEFLREVKPPDGS